MNRHTITAQSLPPLASAASDSVRQALQAFGSVTDPSGTKDRGQQARVSDLHLLVHQAGLHCHKHE